ncbi:MAG: transcription antitermination protein NusB [Rikenellaceae bacterium]
MLSRRVLRIKVIKALYSHLLSGSDNMMASEKSLLTSIDKSYDLYLQLLLLPSDLVSYARSRQEIAAKKHLASYEDLNPNTKFVDNTVSRLVADGDTVVDITTSRKLNWQRDPELIKSLFMALESSEEYQKYMLSEERSLREDVALWEYFFVEIVQNSEMFDQVVEEHSIMWSGDLVFVLPLVIRTLTSIRPSHTDIKLMKKYKSDDDLEFVRHLFQKSLIGYRKNEEYIDKFTRNWDVERIVFIDTLIMIVAMTELTSFPEIPVKVTMDEYIEIAKFYSTASSGTFINGVLDKINQALTQQGEIKKCGRGLL